MNWRDLLEPADAPQTIVLPWLGGRVLEQGPRAWNLRGKLPDHPGWWRFALTGRIAVCVRPAEAPNEDAFIRRVAGYTVGDHFVPDQRGVGTPWCPDCLAPLPEVVDDATRPICAKHAREAVHLEPVMILPPTPPPDLERFGRISAGQVTEGGAWIYVGPAFPLGPEPEVQHAYEDQAPPTGAALAAIPGVTPALEAAYVFASRHRLKTQEAERRAQEAERLRQLRARTGTAEGRRATAAHDFHAAATAALAVGAATLLDVRPGYAPHEKVVRFRVRDRRFECTCHAQTLQIIDAGICLRDHDTGEAGDTYFTLESIPSVIGEAMDAGKLVVFRRVD